MLQRAKLEHEECDSIHPHVQQRWCQNKRFHIHLRIRSYRLDVRYESAAKYPDELWIGPCTAGLDIDYMTGVFKNGGLQYLCAPLRSIF